MNQSSTLTAFSFFPQEKIFPKFPKFWKSYGLLGHTKKKYLPLLKIGDTFDFYCIYIIFSMYFFMKNGWPDIFKMGEKLKYMQFFSIPFKCPKFFIFLLFSLNEGFLERSFGNFILDACAFRTSATLWNR